MASMNITVPDAAIPLIREVCIADGWDQIDPPTLAGYVQFMVRRDFKQKIVALRGIKAQQDIQAAIQNNIIVVDTAFE